MDAIGPIRAVTAGAATPPSAHSGSQTGIQSHVVDGEALTPRAPAQGAASAAAGDGDNSAFRPQDGQLSVSDFSDAELQLLRELRSRDREVRNHELAHLAAAGPHAHGGPSFNYQSGPDGRRYAVGGEVRIDTSAVPGDPGATLAKAQQVRRAALAPANPSAQDRRIAAQATATAANAQAELARLRQSPDGGQTSAATSGVNASAVNTIPAIDLIA